MNKDKVILTDCDGVLLDWEYSFASWMKSHGYRLVDNYSTHYSIHHRYGIEKQEAKKLTRLFNESSDIGYLTPLRDSIKYVRKLHEEHGYVFHVITSLSTSKSASELRKKNLNRVFGKGIFEEVVCLETGADKDDALEPYRDSECYWIEDKPENATLGADLGLSSIIIHHQYNSLYHDSRVSRASNWKEIYRLITD